MSLYFCWYHFDGISLPLAHDVMKVPTDKQPSICNEYICWDTLHTLLTLDNLHVILSLSPSHTHKHIQPSWCVWASLSFPSPLLSYDLLWWLWLVPRNCDIVVVTSNNFSILFNKLLLLISILLTLVIFLLHSNLE